jgi:hypothetical protein
LIDDYINENGGTLHHQLKSDIEALIKTQNKGKRKGLMKRRLELAAAQQSLVQRQPSRWPFPSSNNRWTFRTSINRGAFYA